MTGPVVNDLFDLIPGKYLSTVDGDNEIPFLETCCLGRRIFTNLSHLGQDDLLSYTNVEKRKDNQG